MTKVLICGSRDYDDQEMMWAVLRAMWDTHGPITCVIDGMAKGADMLGYVWAQEHAIRSKRFAADWQTHGKAAGVLRNQQMLDDGQPDIVIAFPKGRLSESRGTADMVRRARAAGIRTIVVGVDDSPLVVGEGSHA